MPAAPLFTLLSAFAVSLVLSLVAERVAPRLGLVAPLRDDRWHRAPVPLLGGAAIATATLAVAFAASPVVNTRLVVLGGGALGMAVVGLVDDGRSLRPHVKLLAQVLFAAVLLHFGFLLRLTGYPFVDVLVTVFWIIGITNAVNLLDNMDGLAATIAVVAAAFRLLFFHWDADATGVIASASFIGAVLGFLVRNFSPARIFMGDTGSLFLGFFLAGLSLSAQDGAYSRGVVAVFLVPVLLLLIPIFDTGFVTATRLLAGRSPAVGGRDHTSHRLVAVGLSERQVVMMLGGLSAAAGGVAVLSYRIGLSQAVVLLSLLVIGLVLLGVYLARVRPVDAGSPPATGTVLRLIADFQYKRQVMTLSLDVCLVVLAYYAAYVIRFEETLTVHMVDLQRSLPVVFLAQVLGLGAFGLYRGIWQYTGLADVVRIVKAVTVGTMAAMVVLLFTHEFIGLSRTVFVLDWVLLVLLLTGSRASFRLFGELFRPAPASFRRVLVYGAGDGGELIVRELLNNPALQRVPVGFIDDDRTKHQTRIHGRPVLGGAGELEEILREHGIHEVIVSSAKIAGNGLDIVARTCEARGVLVRRASFRLE